jgi:hypothetical protein
MVRNRGIDASRDAATAIRNQVEHEIAADPALLQSQITHMRARIVR